MEKSVTDAINFRRSVRKFDPNKEIDSEIVKKCLKNGVLAPTSSNLQLWEFFHITDKDLMRRVSAVCFNQPAASTAKQIVIIVARKDLWRKRATQNIDFFNSRKDRLSKKQYDLTQKYYKKVVPFVYNDFIGFFSYLKYLLANLLGIFRVMYRQLRNSDTRIVAHKSAALASQNFMISMAAQGYDTCPMEGFDSLRLKRLLGVDKKSEINMVIGCGIRLEEGVYGDRFRIPFDQVYTKK